MPTHAEMLADLEREFSELEKLLAEQAVSRAEARLVKLAKDKDWPPDGEELDLSGEDDDDDEDAEGDEDGDEDEDEVRKAAPPLTHKFETAVSRIAHRDGCSKAAAMATARRENPTLFGDYQQSGLVGNAANSGQPLTTFDMEKSALSFGDLVAAEIRKGCSPVVAAQRVAYAHPELARSAITKAAGRAEFMAKCDETMRAVRVLPR